MTRRRVTSIRRWASLNLSYRRAWSIGTSGARLIKSGVVLCISVDVGTCTSLACTLVACVLSSSCVQIFISRKCYVLVETRISEATFSALSGVKACCPLAVDGREACRSQARLLLNSEREAVLSLCVTKVPEIITTPLPRRFVALLPLGRQSPAPNSTATSWDTPRVLLARAKHLASVSGGGQAVDCSFDPT